FVRWEHLTRTNTLGLRAKKLNPDVLHFQEGKHNLRPIPQSFIDNLLREDGSNLTDEEEAAWQNPGY
ncbi:MAG: RagB/SusD family nutrient uptake outer membrane protein, partial [Duncaniella sp.]|nr:RagB/SusD family nutrient uptake outer membrane protein [Duncaniella sp.]